MEIIIIAGLPGSGKSTWAKAQIEKLGDCAHLIDDPSIEPERWEENLDKDIQYLFIADPYFCLMDKEKVERTLRSNLKINIEGAFIRWVCMENNISLSLSRSNKNNKRTEGFSRRLAENYQIPLNAMVLPNEGYQSPWWAAPIIGSVENIPRNKI